MIALADKIILDDGIFLASVFKKAMIPLKAYNYYNNDALKKAGRTIIACSLIICLEVFNLNTTIDEKIKTIFEPIPGQVK